jgi:hypothetical protein
MGSGSLSDNPARSWRSGIISIRVGHQGSEAKRLPCSGRNAKLNIDQVSLVAPIVTWIWSRSFLTSHSPSRRACENRPPLTATWLDLGLFKTPAPQFGGGPDTNIKLEGCRGFPLRFILRIGLRLSPEWFSYSGATESFTGHGGVFMVPFSFWQCRTGFSGRG